MSRIFSFFLLCFVIHSFSVFSQHKVVGGIVIDSRTREPLAFATVGIQGTLFGTATDLEGRFILSISENLNDSSLFCSYMGYKDFSIEVRNIGVELNIELDADTFTLDVVEVRPWTPWQYVWNAMMKIKDNYAPTPFMSKGYYSEYMSENGVFLKFTEGIIETYNPPYGNEEKNQSKVLKARRRDGLGKLRFMRDKIEKKYNRQKRKAEKRGEQWRQADSIDEEILSSSFGGPEQVLSSDPLRDTASFLNIRFREKYKYFIEGYSRSYGEQVIIIGFKSKAKYENQKQSGRIFISLESDAIMAIEYDSKVVIPVLVRPVLFVIGIGISNPEIHAMIHYKPLSSRWYLSDFSIQSRVQLTKKKMFNKNERSQFEIEMAMINNHFDLENILEIPEEQWIDGDKPLEEQVAPDHGFWTNYKVTRPSELKGR